MDINFTDMDVVDANICFSKEYLTKARFTKDKDRLLKLLLMATKSITNAIKQIDNNIDLKDIVSLQKLKP